MFVAPIPADRRPERFLRLIAGLVLYGISGSLLVLAGLGLDPWDVLHQGLSRTFGLQVGTWVIVVGFIVLLGWIPLRQRPGAGTALNVILIGLVMNVVLDVVPSPHYLPVRFGLVAIGVVLNGLATGLYIGAGLGPGPRDGLMTGLAADGRVAGSAGPRRFRSIRAVRTLIEVTVLLAGWLLGGTVGFGTVAYAATIGLLVHWTVPYFAMKPLPNPLEPDEVASESVRSSPGTTSGAASPRSA